MSANTIIGTMNQLNQHTGIPHSTSGNDSIHTLDELRSKWVTEAITAVTDKKDTKHYNTLCEQIQSCYTQHDKYTTLHNNDVLSYSEALNRWFIPLSQCASHLSPKSYYTQLTQLLYKFPYKLHYYNTIHTYHQLIINLMLSQPYTIKDSIDTLCNTFLARKIMINYDESNHTASTDILDISFHSSLLHNINGTTICSTEQIHLLVHNTIQRMVQLIPSSISVLFNVLIEKYPHKRYDTITHQLYCKNLLYITTYIPVLRSRILSAICERLIYLDVEITQNSTTEQSEQIALANKLDGIMSQLFQFLYMIQHTYSNNKQLTDDIYHSLIHIFHTNILKTHKSRFIQYLLFYYCSASHSYAEQYIAYLLHNCIGTNTDIPHIERVSCTSYIASYIARAKYIRHLTAINVFDQCIQWLHQYTQDNTVVDINSDNIASQHELYYCMFQSCMYIFCYRQQSFIHIYDNSITSIQHKYRFDILISSKLNPLRYCDNNIINEFARITYELNIVNCYTVIQYNSQYIRSNNINQHFIDHNHANQKIRLFFPYDPYQLKQSSKYIMDIYNDYSTVDEEDSDIDSNSSSDEDDEIVDEHKSIDVQYNLDRRSSIKRKSPNKSIDELDDMNKIQRISDECSDVCSVSHTMSELSVNPVTGSPILSSPYLHSTLTSPNQHSIKITPLLGNVSPAGITRQYMNVPVFSPLVSATSPLPHQTNNNTNNNNIHVNTIDLHDDDPDESSSSDSDDDDDGDSSTSSSSDSDHDNAQANNHSPATTDLPDNNDTSSDTDHQPGCIDDSDDDLPIAIRHNKIVSMLKG